MCDENAKCVNKIGSYECLCESGYTGNGESCYGNQAIIFLFTLS